MKPLCIYHGHCDDGFAAAWAVRHGSHDSFDFYPGVYQQEPPDVYRLRIEELKRSAYPATLGGAPCWIANAQRRGWLHRLRTRSR